MNPKFERSRSLLSDIIFSKDNGFTKRELIEEFREANGGSIIIGGSDTVSEYLDTLVEIRDLRLIDGRYSPEVHRNGHSNE